jgi:hypothetical protein
VTDWNEAQGPPPSPPGSLPGHGGPRTSPPPPPVVAPAPGPGAPPPGYGGRPPANGGPPPGYGPGGYGGPPPGYGGPGPWGAGGPGPWGAGGPVGQSPVPTVVRHVPSRGLVVGLCGLAALLVSIFALPWITEGGEDVTFHDLRDIFNPDEGAATGPGGGLLAPSAGSAGSGLDSPLTPSPAPGGAPPTTYLVPEPGQVPQTIPVPETAYVPTSDERLKTLEEYTDWTWALVLYFTTVGVVFSTWLVPRERALRMITGFLTGACVGLLVNLADKDGSNAPRIVSTLAALYGAVVHLQALWYLFWDVEGSPSPSVGVWLGLAGLIAVVVACVMGTRREVVPQYS